jgi:hypothetical protein
MKHAVAPKIEWQHIPWTTRHTDPMKQRLHVEAQGQAQRGGKMVENLITPEYLRDLFTLEERIARGETANGIIPPEYNHVVRLAREYVDVVPCSCKVGEACWKHLFSYNLNQADAWGRREPMLPDVTRRVTPVPLSASERAALEYFGPTPRNFGEKDDTPELIKHAYTVAALSARLLATMEAPGAGEK